MLRRMMAMVALLLTGACASTAEEAPENPLAGSSWLVVEAANQAVLPDHPPALTFESAVSVSGNTGCNSFVGQVRVENFGLRLERLASTRMACAGALGEQDSRILSLLGKVGAYRMEGEQLFLLAEDGRRLMSLKPF